jgi:hypothetical protein
MHSNTSRFIATIATCSGLMLPLDTAFAQSPDLPSLTALWWEWAVSIPNSVNPLEDSTGQDCMVGQSGSIWFLAGVFGGGTAKRTCSVPADKSLFFPVANTINVNSPHVCGQKGPLSAAKLRAAIAPFIDGFTSISATVDGQPVANIPRILSIVFDVALPKDNAFLAPCNGDSPPGVYSPAVGDGFYVLLGPLPAGSHTIQFSAQNPSAKFTENVTYNLTVVPVTLQ